MKIIKWCLVLCALSATLSCQKEEAPSAPPPPPEVAVVVTQAQKVPLFQEFVGEVSGFKDITIRARVEGFLEDVHFQEGSEVEEGKLLYTLESQQFEEDVAAKMSRVAEAKTVLAKTEGDLNRIEPLAKMKAVSQSDLDAAVAAYDASVASLQATRANLRASKIQLGYTKIYSPITGIIGKTQAKVGDFVGRDPNQLILNTVSRIDTILVDFFITETQYLEIARHRAVIGLADVKEAENILELILIDGSVYEHKGKADFVGREVDSTTGAILVQASFPNPDKILRPGQFARIKVQARVVEDGILIPQRCVTELQGLFNVFVVDDSNTVKTVEIKVGPKIEQFWLVTEGLQAGQQVIYEGLQKVREGVQVNPTVKKLKLALEEGK
jgi:membrane fusion protein, multidrug efflux system